MISSAHTSDLCLLRRIGGLNGSGCPTVGIYAFCVLLMWVSVGDQALAITRHELEAAGGVPLQMMMEDFELVVRIRK